MLPEVRAALNQLQSLRDVARSKMDQLAVLDALWGDLVSQSANPDHEEYTQHRHSLSEYRRAIEEVIQQRLAHRVDIPVERLKTWADDTDRMRVSRTGEGRPPEERKGCIGWLLWLLPWPGLRRRMQFRSSKRARHLFGR